MVSCNVLAVPSDDLEQFELVPWGWQHSKDQGEELIVDDGSYSVVVSTKSLMQPGTAMAHP